MPWVRRVRVEYPPLTPLSFADNVEAIGPVTCREIMEEFWQDPDGTLITREQWEARSMPRATPWYDRRAAARDPNRELTATVRETERRREQDRWRDYLEEERQRRRASSSWGRGIWFVEDEISALRIERNATDTVRLQQCYRNFIDNPSSTTASTAGTFTVRSGTSGFWDIESCSPFDRSPLIRSSFVTALSMFKAEDLDLPYEVAPPGTYNSSGGGLIGFQAEPGGEVGYFQERSCVPFAHTVRILVRYYDTVEKVRKLFKARGTKSSLLVTPDPKNLVFGADGRGRFDTFDYCVESTWDGGTSCSSDQKRGAAVVFKGGKWHIRARDTANNLYWEVLHPDTL